MEEKALRAKIQESLNVIGRAVIAKSSQQSKVSNIQKLHLRDSGNYRVKPYNTLIVSQYYYGKYNTPKGKETPTDRENLTDTPLNNAINEFVDEEINLLVKELAQMIMSPIIKK